MNFHFGEAEDIRKLWAEHLASPEPGRLSRQAWCQRLGAQYRVSYRCIERIVLGETYQTPRRSKRHAPVDLSEEL